MRVGLASALAAVVMAGGGAGADQLVVTSNKDNTLYESPIGHLSNGAGTAMFCGINGNGGTRRAVLAFDVSAIPPGSTVTSVTLQLSMSMTIAGDTVCGLHRLEADWGEGSSVAPSGQGGGGASATGDATWVHRFYNTSTWDTSGGDYAPNASADQTVGQIGLYTWTGPGLVSDVQGWVDNSAANFGWLLKGDEGTLTTAKRFDTREHANAALRPELTIEYTPGGTCYPDCNLDGQLNLADFGCFQTAFALGNLYADCNLDGQLNLADFGCFQTAFALGCP